MLGWSTLFAVLSMVQPSSCNIEALWGSRKLLVYLLAPFRFPVLHFSGLSDNPAVIKAMVMLKCLVFPSPGKSSFYFITAVTILTKTTKQPKI